MDLTAFAAEVGTTGPVTVAGLSTRGGPVPGVRAVRAPSGIERFQPDEMTVECYAGTPVADLQAALGERGQFVALPDGGTVGGALAVGHAGILRLGHGPVRDTVLQSWSVLADGAVVMAGGPTVKNVSGFDLCRLLVGARGSLGFFGALVLRTRPLPAARRWFTSEREPWTLRRDLFRPTAVLWDGTTTWVCLEGHPHDIDDETARLGLVEVAGPPAVPAGGRSVLDPSTLRRLGDVAGGAGGAFLAEIGVGVVHHADPVPETADATPPAVATVTTRLKRLFDPEGRMSPGREPRSASAATIGAGAP